MVIGRFITEVLLTVAKGEVLVSKGDKFENSNVATIFNIDGSVLTDITDPTLRAEYTV